MKTEQTKARGQRTAGKRPLFGSQNIMVRTARVEERLAQLGGEKITSDFGALMRTYVHGDNRQAVRL